MSLEQCALFSEPTWQVWDSYQSGLFRELYVRADRPKAVLILECGHPKEARPALDSLLVVDAALIHFELNPRVSYPGFAQLFEG